MNISMPSEAIWPILICLLGDFRVLKVGRQTTVRGNKAEAILTHLAMQNGRGVPRDAILEVLWPGRPSELAGQCLNSLLHSLRKSLGEGIQGASPILYYEGTYLLNQEAGVGVDVSLFDGWVNDGNQRIQSGDLPEATTFYLQAIQLYRGNLVSGTNINAVVERERLRASFLSILAHVADNYFSLREYTTCLRYAHLLLEYDPCREDAHRLVMRCYARQGQRAQSLRQYQLCETILRAEFDAQPELKTILLYNQIRLDPDII